MKKMIFLTFITILFGKNLNAQDYYNKIIPFEFGNPATGGLYIHKDQIIIPVIYPEEISTLIVVDNNINYYHYSYFDFSRRPLSIIDDKLYLFAKDRSKQKGLKFMKLKEDFSAEWVKSYDSEGTYNFATYSISLDNHIYCSYFDDFDNKTHREIGLKKIDTLGNEIWSKNYSQNDKLNYPWRILKSNDSNILLSARVVYTDIYGGYPQLIKLDTFGNIIWSNTSTEGVIDGSTPVLLTQLSDSSLVQSYEIDKWNDPEYVINGWNYQPTRMKWYDSNGIFTKEKILTFPRKDDLNFYHLEAGKGEYFFAYGIYEKDGTDQNDNDTIYGLITKYSNDGDTIWTHRYQHSSFDTANYSYQIIDIEELDNGDIVALGKISKPETINKIWLFKVNSAGCFGDETCDEILRTDVFELGKDVQKVNVYPNPASDYINIELPLDVKWEKWNIYSIDGRKILNGSFEQSINTQLILLKNQTTGIYFLQVIGDKGKIGVGKFVIE